jgi:hypothetical protein
MMKHDYLWDKTGGDAEIEGLENLLSGLKYELAAPPRLPVGEVLNASAKTPWWKFSIAFAVPACLLLAVAVGFWTMRLRDDPTASLAASDKPAFAANADPSSTEVSPEARRTAPQPERHEVAKPLKTIFTQRTRSNDVRPVRSKYRQKKQRFETLTSEERFAYDQLKLALSITGAKLKVVSDTVNRTED